MGQWQEGYDVWIGPYQFELVDLDDTFRNTLVKHRYVNTDGVDIEAKGLDAREVRLRGYFLNGAYQMHFDVLAYMKANREAIELEHPKYGILKGFIESITVRHDERIETAEIDLTFVEHADVTVSAGGSYASIESDFESASSAQHDEFASATRDALGSDAQSLLDTVVTEGQGILDQFSSITGEARQFVKTVDTQVARIEATLSSVTQPATSLISTIEWAEDLPGRVASSAVKTIERYTELYSSLTDAPDLFMSALKDSRDELLDALGLSDAATGDGTALGNAEAAANNAVRTQIILAAATVGALRLGEMYEADEADRTAVRKAEGTPAFTVEGEYTRPSPAPEILNVDQVERSLATAREMLQDAVDEARGMDVLRTIAHGLTKNAIKVKLEYERIETVDMDVPMHIFILCSRYGLSYQAAARVLAINPALAKPNAVSGQVRMYVR